MVRSYRGATVSIIGAPEQMPLARIRRALQRQGARLSRRIETDTRVTVIAHGAVGRLGQGRLKPVIMQAGSSLLTEHRFLSDLGLRPRPAQKSPDYDRVAFAAGCRLSRRERFWLELFDVIEPRGGFYDFHDMILARQIRMILDTGVPLADVIAAAMAFRRAAAREAEQRPALPAPLAHGELITGIGTWLAAINDKIARRVDYDDVTLACHLHDLAQAAGQAGDWKVAEMLHRRCAAIDLNDALALFNCANAVRHQGRIAEAASLYRLAVDVDPGLAEAWYELGCLAHDGRDDTEARACFERAIVRDAQHGDATFRLAFLHLDRGELRRAQALFEHYLELDGEGAHAEVATKAAALCRRQLAPEIEPAAESPAPAPVQAAS
jgi:tetratricopeptide (TPR) repeat protein